MNLRDLLFRLRRPALALYVVVVLVLTLAPLPASTGHLPRWFDKVVHFGLFVGMSLFLYWNLSNQARHQIGKVAGVAAALAGVIELVQSPLAFRRGDLWDFWFGAVGAVVGWFSAEAFARIVSDGPSSESGV